MADNTKNQHFVPQRYLRFFETTPSSETVFCLDRQTGIIKPRSVARTGSENYFYRMGERGNYDNSMEDYLHRYENDLGSCIQEAIEDVASGKRLNEDIKWRLSCQITQLLFRTKAMRDMIGLMFDNQGQKILDNVPETDLDPFSHFDERKYQVEFLRDEANFIKWVNAFYNAFWIPILPRSGRVLTSDNPVVMNPCFLDEDSYHLAAELNDLYLPISPGCLLWIIDPTR